MDPCWITEARRHLGVREIPGAGDSPAIQRWLRTMRAWWSDDATPWCGVFVAYCLRECRCEPPRAWYRARSYLDWGHTMPVPGVGAVAILERAGGGHVGFVVGRTATNRIVLLGGNQSDAVTVASFARARVLGYRWPLEGIGAINYDLLPLVAAGGSGGEE